MDVAQKRRIDENARRFVSRWQGRNLGECSDAQTFINEFFAIFDIDRHASNIFFEYSLWDHKRKSYNRIDVFWPGVILIENKSPGLGLAEAAQQANNYYHRLDDTCKPKYIVVNNFHNFQIHEEGTRNKNKARNIFRKTSFSLNELPENIHLFYYLLDHEPVKITKEVVHEIRYGILVLASSLSLTLGHVVSDGKSRAYLEGVMEGFVREESTR